MMTIPEMKAYYDAVRKRHRTGLVIDEVDELLFQALSRELSAEEVTRLKKLCGEVQYVPAAE